MDTKALNEYVERFAEKVGVDNSTSYLSHMLSGSVFEHPDRNIMSSCVTFAQNIRTVAGLSLNQAKQEMGRYVTENWKSVPEHFQERLSHLQPVDKPGPVKEELSADTARLLNRLFETNLKEESPEIIKHIGSILADAIAGKNSKLLVISDPKIVEQLNSKLAKLHFSVQSTERKDKKINVICQW